MQATWDRMPINGLSLRLAAVEDEDDAGNTAPSDLHSAGSLTRGLNDRGSTA